MVLCQVKGCKYADYHVTSFHKCGKCNNFGHGQQECDDANALKHLGFYYFLHTTRTPYQHIVLCNDSI